ncbi:MAG: FHA domain-containing protein, partial [Gammaproteobacteria bacterium]
IKPGSASAAVAAAKAAEDAGAAAAAPTPSAPQGTAAPAASGGMPLGRLTVLNGPIAGKELELTKALITLGKPGTQVAVISRRPQGYFLTHIESSGGFPVVNGDEIGAKAYQLKDGDTIELASIKMEFTLT